MLVTKKWQESRFWWIWGIHRMKATKQGERIHPAFETKGRNHQKSKTGTSGPTTRTTVLQKLKQMIFLGNIAG